MQTATSSRTQKLIAVGAVVALALISLQAYTLMANGTLSQTGIHTASGSTDPPSNSTISVTGTGLVNIQPDRAILTVGVTTQDSSAQAAAQQNAVTMNNVISALEAMGINNSSIQTTSYDIQPQTTYDSGTSVITGYMVTNEIQVTIQATGASLGTLGAKVGQAIDAATGQGANEVYGIQFTASNAAIQQATNQALQLAVQDASSQAKIVAAALGVTVTGAISVDASPSYPSPMVLDAGVQSSVSTPVVVPQSLQIEASVQAVYATS
jgi:hypothetical protein